MAAKGGQHLEQASELSACGNIQHHAGTRGLSPPRLIHCTLDTDRYQGLRGGRHCPQCCWPPVRDYVFLLADPPAACFVADTSRTGRWSAARLPSLGNAVGVAFNGWPFRPSATRRQDPARRQNYQHTAWRSYSSSPLLSVSLTRGKPGRNATARQLENRRRRPPRVPTTGLRAFRLRIQGETQGTSRAIVGKSCQYPLNWVESSTLHPETRRPTELHPQVPGRPGKEGRPRERAPHSGTFVGGSQHATPGSRNGDVHTRLVVGRVPRLLVARETCGSDSIRGFDTGKWDLTSVTGSMGSLGSFQAVWRGGIGCSIVL